mmetsp:Transcript_22874/g.22145  ORF Transcript_22874/g.22145 Transcript_22874/m.22145 type:complete len:189 (+) Transcript_22874:1063-1629(+)
MKKASQVYMNQKAYEEACTLLRKLKELDPYELEPQFQLAHACYLSKNYDEAQTIYMRAIRISKIKGLEDFNDPFVYPRLGTIFYQKGDYSEALNVFTMSLASSKKFCYSMVFMGKCNDKLECYEEAIKLLTEANFMDPENEEVWEYLADCVEKFGGSKVVAFQAKNEAAKLKALKPKLVNPGRKQTSL